MMGADQQRKLRDSSSQGYYISQPLCLIEAPLGQTDSAHRYRD
ncbi:hypothetical protein ACFTAO_43680 [Paenibacillus rhizoplanae]